MPEKGKRQLAAIMFADMVGYTALMQADEGEARAQRDRHRAIIGPSVEAMLGDYRAGLGMADTRLAEN